MKSNLEEELWESFLKSAVLENSFKEANEFFSEEKIKNAELPPHYTKVMRKFLLKYQQKKWAKIFFKSLYKVASIVLIIMGISFSILLQFCVVRAACKNIVTYMYDRYIEYFFLPNTSLQSTIFTVGYVPDGFHLASIQELNTEYVVTYQNGDDEIIKLVYLYEPYVVQLDNEHYIIRDIKINGNQGTYFHSNTSGFYNVLTWNTSEKFFIMYSTLDKDAMIKIAESISF